MQAAIFEWKRKAAFRAFRLPGGERATREP